MPGINRRGGCGAITSLLQHCFRLEVQTEKFGRLTPNYIVGGDEHVESLLIRAAALRRNLDKAVNRSGTRCLFLDVLFWKGLFKRSLGSIQAPGNAGDGGIAESAYDIILAVEMGRCG